MKTLIELYDERPIENVLATEVFEPKTTVFLCPGEIAQNKRIQKNILGFFRSRGVKTKVEFIEASLYSAEKVRRQLERVAEKYPDCVLDITGGTDAALFASGLMCAGSSIPVFTYSRKGGCFYNIRGADFADRLKCEINHSVRDCFMMAGGDMRQGRFENGILKNYFDKIDPFFEVYMKNRASWQSAVNYIQSVSASEKGAVPPLEIDAPYTVFGDRNRRVNAPEQVLRALEEIGFIRELEIVRDRSVRFSFADENTRQWMRDVGSVLELYVYKACVDAGIFNDVYTSAIVDWEGGGGRDNVTNEIDVIAMRRIIPLFISCKTCRIDTEALNELEVLRERFGGYGAKAAIVTSSRSGAMARHRASELDIHVIDLEDLRKGNICEIIERIMR